MNRRSRVSNPVTLSIGAGLLLMLLVLFLGTSRVEAADPTEIDFENLTPTSLSQKEGEYNATTKTLTLRNGSFKGKGTFDGTVYIADATLTEGTFTGPVEVSGTGTIAGGTYNGEVVIETNGSITGGTFCNTVASRGTIQNGDFRKEVYIESGSVTGGTFKSTSTVVNVAEIKSGTFDGSVTNGNANNTNAGTISGGTFTGTVTNQGKSTITDGSFYEQVTNHGTINDGNFTGPAANYGTINGGIFNGILTHSLSYNLTGIESSLQYPTVEDKSTYATTLSLADTHKTGYRLPDAVTVTINGVPLGSGAYTYDSENGRLQIDSGVITNPITITAAATPMEYGVTYELNGGAFPVGTTAAMTYTYEKGLTLPIPQKQGFVFWGWYSNDQFTGDKVEEIAGTETGARTFYARWASSDARVTAVQVGDKQGTIDGNAISVVLSHNSSLPTKEQIEITAVEGAEVGKLTKTSEDSGKSVTWTFTVTAKDGVTTNDYTLTVSLAANPAAENIADVNAAKSVLTEQAEAWKLSAEEGKTQESAKQALEKKLSELSLNGAGHEVSVIRFTPQESGTKEHPAGAEGSVEYQIRLFKGTKGQDDYAEEIFADTVGISAVPYADTIDDNKGGNEGNTDQSDGQGGSTGSTDKPNGQGGNAGNGTTSGAQNGSGNKASASGGQTAKAAGVPGSARTGDTANVSVLMLLAALSLAGISGVLVMRKRR